MLEQTAGAINVTNDSLMLTWLWDRIQLLLVLHTSSSYHQQQHVLAVGGELNVHSQVLCSLVQDTLFYSIESHGRVQKTSSVFSAHTQNGPPVARISNLTIQSLFVLTTDKT